MLKAYRDLEREGLGKPPVPGPGGSGHQQVPLPQTTPLRDCVAKLATQYHEVVTYQPASRYWAFQWYELAIFVGAALVLSGFCFWWIRRRLA